MTAPARWSVWRPSDGPFHAPERPKGHAVLVTEDLFAGTVAEPVVRPSPVFPLGPRYVIATRRPDVMGAVMDHEAPAFVVPSLLVDRTGDLDAAAVRALCQIRARHRALVVRPQERLDLGLFAEAPAAWGVGCRAVWELIHLVVVAGPEAAVVPGCVRDLRDQAADAGVAFTFLGVGGPLRGLEGRTHGEVPWLHRTEDGDR